MVRVRVRLGSIPLGLTFALAGAGLSHPVWLGLTEVTFLIEFVWIRFIVTLTLKERGLVISVPLPLQQLGVLGNMGLRAELGWKETTTVQEVGRNRRVFNQDALTPSLIIVHTLSDVSKM